MCIYCVISRIYYKGLFFSVGGGIPFSPTAGGGQVLAAGLVPAGLTPVAFFPPEPTQQLQAFSVIFLEAPLKKRKRRHVEGRGLDKLYGPFYKHFKYYKANLWRFTNMVRRGEFDKLLRPGKFSTEPLNNLGQILRFTDAHFGGLVNSTKTRYNI